MPLHLQDGDASLDFTPTGVQATTSWCRATVPLTLAPGELSRLADGLRTLDRAQTGSFLWTNEGGELRIEIVMAKRGETHWSIRLQSPPDFLHELRLVFVGRQDDLQTLANRL